jgi:hypothetical protein
VAAFERSGLNRTEYCRQHGLSLSSLKRFSKRTGKSRGWSDQSECAAPAVSLIPVEVLDDRPAAQQAWQTSLFVELCGGRRIGVGAGLGRATLRRLMAVPGEV